MYVVTEVEDLRWSYRFMPKQSNVWFPVAGPEDGSHAC